MKFPPSCATDSSRGRNNTNPSTPSRIGTTVSASASEITMTLTKMPRNRRNNCSSVAGRELAPKLLNVYAAVIWEDQDECLEVRPEDVAV